MKKRVLSILLSVSLMIGCMAAGTEAALAAPNDIPQQTERQHQAGGLLPFEERELPQQEIADGSYAAPAESAESQATSEDTKAAGGKANPKSAVYKHSWDKYSTYYFYNQMSNAEQALYDKLYQACRDYLANDKPVKTFLYRGQKVYYTGQIKTGTLTQTKASNVMNIFRFSNPQFYFLNNVGWFGSNTVGIGVYKAFAYGSQRKMATANVQKQMNAWQKEVDKGSTDFEKARIAHDLINKKVRYNDDFYNEDGSVNEGLDEEQVFSQTAYSAICMDKTVCAGYSQAFEMLCNGAGIDTIAVTSQDHEWNKIRLEDSWYNVDCTWDDYDQGGQSLVLYDFFVRSDAAFDKADREDPIYYNSHKEESYWNGLLPKCSLDSGSTMKAPGTLPQISEKTAAPAISYNKETRTATLSCETKGADIYYSLDGSQPSPASVKCRKYKGKAFTADGSFQIRAVAATDAHLDSDTAATEKMQVPPLVNIRFSGNGATSGSMTSLTYDILKASPLPANKFKRKGYNFSAWNTKANGSGTKYANRQRIKSQIPSSSHQATFYAQWKPIKYTIKYSLKGGTNSSRNPSYYYTNKTVKLQKATRSGYTFQGWYSDKACKKRITSIKKGSTGSKTLYAKWQKRRP